MYSNNYCTNYLYITLRVSLTDRVLVSNNYLILTIHILLLYPISTDRVLVSNLSFKKIYLLIYYF